MDRLERIQRVWFWGNYLPYSPQQSPPEWRWPFTNLMQPVFIPLSLFTSVKKNYELTELGIAGFVWVVKKVRHIIKSSKAGVIIQIDHLAIIDIFQQLSIISTISTMRLIWDWGKCLNFSNGLSLTFATSLARSISSKMLWAAWRVSIHLLQTRNTCNLTFCSPTILY